MAETAAVETEKPAGGLGGRVGGGHRSVPTCRGSTGPAPRRHL